MILLYQFMPMRDPLLGSWDYWYLMLLPLASAWCFSGKPFAARRQARYPARTARAFVKFVISFALLAAVLWVIVLFLERRV